jgi:hypothetical protein
MSTEKYIPSTTEGKTWNTFTTKNRQGFVQAVAIEGVLEEYAGGHSFAYTLFEAHQVRVTTSAKRATAKAEAQALSQLRSELEAKGLIRG